MKYLFIVEYKDGSHYHQSPDDCSQMGKNTSSFGDVRQEDVARFSLRGNGHTYTVDLSDGHFEIDGISFRMHEGEASDPKLVYHRRNWLAFGQQGAVQHRIVFRFGWTDAYGQERIMEIE